MYDYSHGVALEETEDRSEPYENPYPQLLGKPEEHRAWRVPAERLKDGVHDIEITLRQGLDAAQILFLDMALT